MDAQIQELTEKHRKIEDLIKAEMANAAWDEMRIADLKKEKLRLKDQLERLRSASH